MQSDAAVSGDAGGRGHTVWRDLHNTRRGAEHRVAYAAVPARAAAPSEVNGTISHGVNSRGALAVLAHAGAIHVLCDEVRYNETVLWELYHVERPAGGEWGPPTNVSRNEAGPVWSSLRPDGGEPLEVAGNGCSSPVPGPLVVVALLSALTAARKIHPPRH